MNLISYLLTNKFVEALGWTLLHSIWQGAVVAVLLAITLILLRKNSSKLRYIVSSIALTAMLVASAATFLSIFLQNTAKTTQLQSQYLQQGKEMQANQTLYIQLEKSTIENAWDLLNFFSAYFSQHLPLIVTIWFLGVIVLMLRFLGAFAYLQRLKHYRTFVVEKHWQQKVNQLAERLEIKKKIQLLESSVAQVPMVIGYFKPVILVPLGTLSGLSPAQVESLLAHEVAHIYRNDYLVNLLQSLVEIVYFYHPAIWWMSNQIRNERENCCDDIAIQLTQDNLTFARTLAMIEEMRYIAAPQMAMAINGQKGILLQRIKRIVSQNQKNATFSEGFWAAFILLIFLFTASFQAKAFLEEKQDEAKNTTTQKETLKETKRNPQYSHLLTQDTQKEEKKEEKLRITEEDTIRFGKDFMLITRKNGKVEVYKNGTLIPEEEYAKYENDFLVKDEEIRLGAATNDNAVHIKVDKPSKQTASVYNFSFIPPIPNMPDMPDMPIWIMSDEDYEKSAKGIKLKDKKGKVITFDAEDPKAVIINTAPNFRFNFSEQEWARWGEEWGKEWAKWGEEFAEQQKKQAEEWKLQAEEWKLQAEEAEKQGERFKELIDMIKKDGLGDKDNKLVLEIKTGSITINGKKLEGEMYQKYKTFFKEKMNLDVEEKDMKWNFHYEE
ncbi:MAG: hypothetical protein EAZ55_12555 [Cytophagales bacterium]|nr:MAG: hypothetical protein EAZ55_12555 [Cytophagales bacterium]